MADVCALAQLSDATLLQQLSSLVHRERALTAELLAHLAEAEVRRLYLAKAYPSMFAYCVGELGFSEDAAFKRIRAARAAREFPAIHAAVADGRLHLAGVVLLNPHLTATNAAELIKAAAHRSKAEIEQLLAERFPRRDVVTLCGRCRRAAPWCRRRRSRRLKLRVLVRALLRGCSGDTPLSGL